MSQYRDIVIAILVVLLAFLPPAREAKRNGFTKHFYFLTILSMVLTVLVVWKASTDYTSAAELSQAAGKIAKQSANIDTLLLKRKVDSINFDTFQKALREQFHIRDSSGKPVLEKNYHIEVKQMRDMNFD
jgi:hypothetical protein